MTKYYVTMTDRFLSGWGNAAGKVEKYIIACDTMQQAITAAAIAKKRSEMRYISIRTTRPYYDKNAYHSTFVDISGATGFQGQVNMKIDTLVKNVQKLFATNVNLFGAKDVAKLLAECTDLMNDCSWVYSQELRGDNLIFVYALERCEEKLKFLIERATQNYLKSTGNYVALLNALDDIKESALSTARMQIEIWLHDNTDLTDEQIFNLVWNGGKNE